MIVLLLSAAPAMAVNPQCTPEQPVAKVHPDAQEVNEMTSVKLNGNPSTPSKLTYLWTQDSNDPYQVQFDDQTQTASQASFKAPDVAVGGTTLHFTLTVKDCSGTYEDHVPTSVTVLDTTVVNPNQPPVATATVSPTSIFEEMLVTLDGSGSYDPDNGPNPLTYTWTQIGGPTVTLANVTPTGSIVSFTAPNVAYPSGASLTFRLTLLDGYQSSYIDQIVNIQGYNEPPIARLSCPATVAEHGLLTLDGTGSSDSDDGIASYAWSQLLGVPTATLPDPATTASISFAVPSLTSNLDTMTFKLIVTDNSGLPSSANCAVKVLDVTPPAFTNVPADKTAEATSAEGATVSYVLPDASDLVDGTVAVTCTPASDSTFPLDKKTPVTCTAQDKASSRGPEGTLDNMATTSFAITVQDTTPPVIAAHADLSVEATGPSGASVTYDSPATSDAVDGNGTATCLPASGSTFALGASAITCSATDTHGNNASSTSFSVTVVDTTPPTISGLPEGIKTVATAASGAAATFNPTAADIVDGPVAVTCTPPAGSTFSLGTTAVRCSATDAHGNNVTAGFRVAVNYGFNGLLSPYNASKAYKIKSAIPLKWQYTTNTGAALPSSTAKPSVLIYQVSNGVDAAEAITLDDAGASGYQYDSTTNTWQFNWKTTGLTAGTYDVYIQSGVTGQMDGPFPVKLAK